MDSMLTLSIGFGVVAIIAGAFWIIFAPQSQERSWGIGVVICGLLLAAIGYLGHGDAQRTVAAAQAYCTNKGMTLDTSTEAELWPANYGRTQLTCRDHADELHKFSAELNT